MRVTSLAVFVAFIAKVHGDFNAWANTCCTGLEGGCWSFDSVSTDAQSHCGGCVWGKNPCNCNESWDYRQASDGNYGIHANGGNIGWCQHDNRFRGACNAWNYSCSVLQNYRCITANCGPHKKRSEGLIEAPAVKSDAINAKQVDGYTQWESPAGRVKWKALPDGTVEWWVGDKLTIRPIAKEAPAGVQLEKRETCFA